MTERTEEETVALTIENRIAWVSFNRPEKRNCMSPNRSVDRHQRIAMRVQPLITVLQIEKSRLTHPATPKLTRSSRANPESDFTVLAVLPGSSRSSNF